MTVVYQDIMLRFFVSVRNCRLFLGVFLLGCLCGCPKTNLQPPPKPQTHKLSPQRQYQLQQAYAQGGLEAEIQLWERWLQASPKQPWVVEGYIRVGLYAYHKKQWRRAIVSFQKALQHPLSVEQRQRLAPSLCKALFFEKRYKEIERVIPPHLKVMKPYDRRWSTHILALAAEKRQQPIRAFVWNTQLFPLLPKVQQPTMRKKLEQAYLNFSTSLLQQLLQERRTQDTGYPYNAMALRLASLHLRSKDKKATLRLLRQWRAAVQPTPLYSRWQTMYRQVVPKAVTPKKASKPSQPSPPQEAIAMEAEPLRLGVLIAQTGKGAMIGKLMWQGIQLAHKQHPQIRLVVRDTQSSPAAAARAVRELALQHKVVAILGPGLGHVAAAAGKEAEKLKVPMVSITPREGFARAGRYLFRNNITLSQMGRAVARYACNRLKLRRLGVLTLASPFGQIQARAFIREVRKLGGKVVRVVSYKKSSKSLQKGVTAVVGRTYSNSKDLRVTSSMLKGMKTYQKRRLYRKIRKRLKPLTPYEGLFVPDSALRMSQIAAHLAYLNVSVRPAWRSAHGTQDPDQTTYPSTFLLGSNGWYSSQLFRAGPEWVEGGLFAVRYSRHHRSAERRWFRKMYRQEFNREPIHISAYSYDSARLLMYVAKTHKHKRRDLFRKSLLQVRGFPAVTGPLHVQYDGNIIGPFHFLMANKKRFFRVATLPAPSLLRPPP
ncbi:MAG: amino acid ABC transporter substrate-binding protein [Deltaproteobacteria bacterium]|nr:MAG: amino acid ABC transporter substrate-binding protein [Deltaproteobacteria bacterium]